ncbi:hypothetical protein L9F63_014634 [Diploptera punctata]|uniref:Secreted protein n=1 Tax=Diploptera punctata TaxID=6984 RepID=A0AAD8EKF8_DIPPU|nr:hypothetical protein L9F63_014634 [Diploptera punctata]
MTITNNIFHLALLISCAGALIIPEELPSLLSVIYSNIPPIKKGTDSRLGLGFRLGEHADFQVLLELGPQTNTQPLGPNADSKTRRQIQRPVVQSTGNTDKVADTPGGKWLSSWKSGFIIPMLIGKETKISTAEEYQIIENPMLKKKDIMLHLQQLYKKESRIFWKKF